MLRSSVLVALAVVLSAVLTAAAPVAQMQGVMMAQKQKHEPQWYDRKFMGVNFKRVIIGAVVTGAVLAANFLNIPSDGPGAGAPSVDELKAANDEAENRDSDNDQQSVVF